MVLVGLLAAALIIIFRLYKMCLKWAKDWDQYEEKCYYFNFIKSSWNDSRRSCADLGSDLVKIDSREEQMFLNKRLRDLMVDDEDKFWIGLTDSGEEGRWFWSGNIPDADCVRMGRKGDGGPKCWFDRFCDHLQKSICEKKPNQKNMCVFF
uniref:C-type lectin domain-containing protein n=1 Tax=Xiphophorus maculatus TaxID=8083 RepID=A0A3B5QGD2_XIPMA